MKVLVATDGRTLESRISRRFGKAGWYLVVDVENQVVEEFPNLTVDDHHNIILESAGLGVSTVITGNLGPRTYELISSNNLRIALARNMTAREAIEHLEQGRLKILDAPTLKKSVEEHELLMKDRREQFSKRRNAFRGRGIVFGATPRGQHHLQQYGGRGH